MNWYSINSVKSGATFYTFTDYFMGYNYITTGPVLDISDVWKAAQSIQDKFAAGRSFKDKLAYSVVLSQTVGTSFGIRTCAKDYAIYNNVGSMARSGAGSALILQMRDS